MKVVLPMLNGKVYLLRDENNYLRPAMGKGDPQQIAEHLFGLHGFSDNIGACQLGGETVEFYILGVKQEIPSSKKSDAKIEKIGTAELYDAIKGSSIALNLFLNMAIRMYYDKVV